MKMNDNICTLQQLKKSINNFVTERDWIKYHTPRNLAESICIESTELLELFQWALKDNFKKNQFNDFQNSNIADELADIFIYCISLSNTLEIDITQIILNKIKKNKKKYPINKFKGRL
jgi:dCTP diphosphatase